VPQFSGLADSSITVPPRFHQIAGAAKIPADCRDPSGRKLRGPQDDNASDESRMALRVMETRTAVQSGCETYVADAAYEVIGGGFSFR
jgi:hypothetical protein